MTAESHNAPNDEHDPWASVLLSTEHYEEPDDGLMYASPLDVLRDPADRGERITPEEYARRVEAGRQLPLQGELTNDDIEFKTAIAKVVADFGDRPPRVAYNPGSGEHVSLAGALPDTRTIFVDTDGDVQHRFIQHNVDEPNNQYEFYREDFHHFVLPEGLMADVVLIFNAYHMTEQELDLVTAEHGLVIVNDWHGAASYMNRECPGYKSLGTVPVTNGDLSNTLHVFKKA